MITVLDMGPVETAPCGCRFRVARLRSDEGRKPLFSGRAPQAEGPNWGWIQSGNPQVPEAVMGGADETETTARASALAYLAGNARARAPLTCEYVHSTYSQRGCLTYRDYFA